MTINLSALSDATLTADTLANLILRIYKMQSIKKPVIKNNRLYTILLYF